MQPNKPKQPNM